jgi:RND family efflux transporter MFP subunit
MLAPAGVLAALAALAGLRGSAGEPIRAQTAEVTQGTIARRTLVTGTLQAARTVALGSEVSGTIHSIEADFNDRVRKGQVVARLDPSVYQAQITEAEARLAQARAEHARLQAVVDDARRKVARAETLAAEDVVSTAELDLARLAASDAEAALKAGAADITATQAMLDRARLSVNRTIIRSPIDGIVVSRHVNVGQTVAASVQTPLLFTVADLRYMQVLAEISEADVGGVRSGSKATLQVESIGDQQFEGTVAAVRLQPLLEQAAASSTGGGAGPPVPTGTSGTSAAAGPGTSSARQPSAPSPAGAGATQTSPPGPSSAAASGGTSASSSSQASEAGAATGGVVTYTVVIDVNNATGTVPPGGTAIITLATHQRPDAIRIPNAALAFRPSAEAFKALNQEPPVLEPSQLPHEELRPGTRRAYVWKVENRRFVPIAVEAGLADDFWTELVEGPLRPGDVLLTAAEPTRK